MAHIDQNVNNETKTTDTADLFSVDYPVMGTQEKTMKTTIKVARSIPGAAYPQVSVVDSDVTYSPDELTVVTSSEGKLYSKVLVFSEDGSYQGKINYGGHFEHTVENHAVPTMLDLEAAIRSLGKRPTSCVLRAQVFDDLVGQEVRRTNSGDWSKSGWKSHCFAEVPRSWACLDVDGKGDGEVIFPGANLWTEATTAKERATQVASWLVNVWLPKNFRHKDAVVQWSSSYGLDGRLERVRAHVWVRFTAPLGSVLLGKWIKDVAGPTLASDGLPYVPKTESGKDVPGARRLDYSTVRTNVQPNYTAVPLFNRGGTLVPHPEKAGEFIGVQGGVSFDDPHADYRVIRVNGNGSFGYAVDAQPIIDDMEALWAKENEGKEAKDGQVKSVSDAPAQLSMLDWTAKDRADYDLAEYALSFLKEGHVDNYDGWIAKGIELKSRFPGAEGLSLWTQWSLTWSGATSDEIAWECEQKWSTFTPVRGGRSRGFGSLIRDARAAGMVDGPGAAQHDDEDAPELPTFLAELEVEPKSKAAYRIQVSKAVALLMRDSEVCKLAAAYFDHAGETRLLDFLGTLAGFGATKAVVAQMAKKLTPRKAVELTLPLVDGHPIEMTEVPGFVVSNGGVYRETFSDVGERSLTKVLSQPLFILSEDTPLGVGHGDVVKLTLTWHKDNRWSTHRISAPDIAEKSKVVAVLSALGLEITSTVAVGVVDYIQAYRESNRVFIDKRTYTSRMGWQIRDGEVLGYTLGQTWIPFVGNDHGIDYQPEDGAKSDAANFSAKAGSLKSWSEMVSRLQGHPIAASMLYASACAPLLQVVDAQGFTLDLGGKTSTGKTTAMRVAASVWGSPIDGDPRRVFSSWKTTINAFEARCARTNDLPLMLDDTKEASSPGLTSSAVYMITNGDSKDRATQTGSYRAAMKFRKVLISTGENLILDNNEHGGVRARVLSLTGLPLGSKSQEAGILARRLTTDASANYGHAGEALIRALCDGTLSWVDLRAEYTALKQALEATTGDESITTRLAAYVALLQLAGRLLVNICGVDLPVDDHIAAIWTLCTKAATESDPVANALSLAWNYIAKQPNRLEGSTDAPLHGQVPSGGWLGRRCQKDGKAVVYILPDELKKVLQDAGHNFNALTRAWSDDGLIASDKEGKHSVKVRIAGTPLRALCFNLDAVLSTLGVSEANTYESDTDSPI